jgi:hypothetical protein
MIKKYKTTGYILHKGFFLLLFAIWVALLASALIIRLSELWHTKQKLFSLIPFFLLALFTAYIVYVMKITSLRIETSIKGLAYERGIRKGLRFIRRRLFVTWLAVKSVSMLSGLRGPLSIDTEQGEFLYWNMMVPQENAELAKEIEIAVSKWGK